MIYFLYGNNIEKRRGAMDDIILGFGGAEAFKHNGGLNEAGLDEFIKSRGLFTDKQIVILENIFEDDQTKELILGKLEEMKDSPNIFVIIEGEPGKKIISRLKKVAEKAEGFSIAQPKVREFNVFSLTDALGERNKKNLWLNLQKAGFADAKPEEVQGILFWQIKNMILAQESSEDEHKNLNLNPFVLKKALGYSRNFENQELKKISSKLIENYHEARRGRDPMIGLERLILENL